MSIADKIFIKQEIWEIWGIWEMQEVLEEIKILILKIMCILTHNKWGQDQTVHLIFQMEAWVLMSLNM